MKRIPLFLIITFGWSAAVLAHDPFCIMVVDEATSRGIPAVLLSTTDRDQLVTDSAGRALFDRPDLMGKPVFFRLESYGYEYPGGPYSFRGLTVTPEPGKSITIGMKRSNIAQRIYRLTGADVYGASRLLGKSVPDLGDPGQIPVTGQDSTHAVLYEGRLFWIWGDTNVANFPLGNFKVTGAWSDLPGHGGLDPREGVRYEYFRDNDGKLSPMVDIEHSGPVWLTALRVARDDQGQEVLLANYFKVRFPLNLTGYGIARYDDDLRKFQSVLEYDQGEDMIPVNLALAHRVADQEYLYLGSGVPDRRAPSRYADQVDLASYEYFTCLQPGTRFEADGDNPVARDADGKLLWGWKKGTSAARIDVLNRLVQQGRITDDERWFRLIDVDSGWPIYSHSGNIAWNPWRGRWIALILEKGGRSNLGEMWYFEGDTPMGPWAYGTRVATHYSDKNQVYSFYNPIQHPYFQQENGRRVFFEGTFVTSFNNAPTPAIPRYNYNQLMYMLELDDPRLALPVPVYQTDEAQPRWRTKLDLPAGVTTGTLQLAFFAPDRPRQGTVPVYETATAEGSLRLTLQAPNKAATPVFYALPGDWQPPVQAAEEPKTREFRPADEIADQMTSTASDREPLQAVRVDMIVPVHQFAADHDGTVVYSATESIPGRTRSQQPVFFAWRNPIGCNPLAQGE